MAAYRRVDDLTVTCRLTACTPGSAPGPTLGVEYGKPLPFYLLPCASLLRCSLSDSPLYTILWLLSNNIAHWNCSVLSVNTNVAVVAFRFHRCEVTAIVDELADDLYMLQRTGSLPVMMQVDALWLIFLYQYVCCSNTLTLLMKCLWVYLSSMSISGHML